MSKLNRKRLGVSMLAVLVGIGWFSSIANAAGGIEPYIKMRWPDSGQLAPDGTLYFRYNPDGIFQLYKVAPGKTQKDAVKLTTFPDGLGSYSLSEDGKYIVIMAAKGGNEQFSMYLMDTATAKIETLYDNPEHVYTAPVWRRDSKAFAFRANDESPTDFYVYVHDIEKKTKSKAMVGKGQYDAADFSKDGSKLVVSKTISATYSQLFEVTLATGDSREITPKGEEWAWEAVGYGPGDKVFYVNSDYKSDLRAMHEIDMASGAIKPILTEFSSREVDWATMNEDRSILAVAVNEDGYSTLHLRKSGDLSQIKGPPMAKGVVGNVGFTGKHMLFSLDNANTPGLIFKWDHTQPATAPVALTEADTQGLDVSKFPLPELVHYESFDGQKIPAFVYLPKDYKKGTKIPFLVQYHGGPESQYRPNFSKFFQYFANEGYGVIAPNVRGSSGYGKAFLEADNYKNRTKSVKDGIWAAKYVIAQGYSEPKLMAAWGGSYGGFMTMAVITEAPELFGAACNVVGIVNFQTFLEKTAGYRRALREVEYGPLSDPEFLKSVSPIYKVDQIKVPLMIAHGANDPRVPLNEAMQIAIALKKAGKPVEELYFPDEGHGFVKEENRLLYAKELVKFFDKYLKNKS